MFDYERTLNLSPESEKSGSSADVAQSMANIRDKLAALYTEDDQQTPETPAVSEGAKLESPPSPMGAETGSPAVEEPPFHQHPRWQELQAKKRELEEALAERERLMAERERELATLKAERQREQEAFIASLRPDLAEKLGLGRPTVNRVDQLEKRILEQAQTLRGNNARALAIVLDEAIANIENRYLPREVWEQERFQTRSEREATELTQKHPEFAEQPPQVQKDFINTFGPFISQGAYTLNTAWEAYSLVKLSKSANPDAASIKTVEDAARLAALQKQGAAPAPVKKPVEDAAPLMKPQDALERIHQGLMSVLPD